MTKCKINNLFDIIIKIVTKCCATHCQGNYTKDKQEKAIRQYQKIWKKKALVICYLEDTAACEDFWPDKLFIMGKNDQEILIQFFLCVKITMS